VISSLGAFISFMSIVYILFIIWVAFVEKRVVLINLRGYWDQE